MTRTSQSHTTKIHICIVHLLEYSLNPVLWHLEFEEDPEDSYKNEGSWRPYHRQVGISLHFFCDLKHLQELSHISTVQNRKHLTGWFSRLVVCF